MSTRKILIRDPKQKLWNAGEIAAYFSVTSRTVGRWRTSGLVPYVVLPGGGSIRYDPEAVEEALVHHPARTCPAWR